MEEVRTRVKLEEHGIANAHTTAYPGTYTHLDDSFNIDAFKQNLNIQVNSLSENELEFQMKGVDPAIANALRRILLSEVPTMAIDKVLVTNNTSVIPDEILAHRLGLIPIKADPRLFVKKTSSLEEPSGQDTLVFELKVHCKERENPRGTDDSERYVNHKVFSKQLKWIPIDNQADYLRESDVKPVSDDILIAKLRPGQIINLKVHAVKGIGKDHAKFSPVATAFYRMFPEIVLKAPIYDEQAHCLQRCFADGVIGIKQDPKTGRELAFVADASKDRSSREIFDHDDLKNLVVINRIRDHLIFSIESTGALEPDVLFTEAIRTLHSKCELVKTSIATALNDIEKGMSSG